MGGRNIGFDRIAGGRRLFQASLLAATPAKLVQKASRPFRTIDQVLALERSVPSVRASADYFLPAFVLAGDVLPLTDGLDAFALAGVAFFGFRTSLLPLPMSFIPHASSERLESSAAVKWRTRPPSNLTPQAEQISSHANGG